MNRLGASALVAAIILVFGRLPTFASEAAIRENEINPWRNKNGSLVDGAVLMSPGGAGRPSSGPASARNAGLAEETGKPLRVVLPANLPMAGVASAFEQGEEIGIEPAALYEMPREEYNTYAGGDPRALNDRGIDYADTKWRRQARITGIRMRMLNGPELAVAYDGISTNLEQGSRTSAGAVAPINTRWEMAAINNFTAYESKPTGAEAALDAVTIRLNGNPSVSKRPWAAITPFAGMRDGRGRGIGVS
ncbi:MAG: hypothetical protein LBE84_10880, partial [Planctomycetota bacterium]|nr:hypothetical protein [Planctomycetota bacterium]